MSTTPHHSADDGVIRAYQDHLQAMVDGGTDVLDALLDDAFTLNPPASQAA